MSAEFLHGPGYVWPLAGPEVPERGAVYRSLVLQTNRCKVPCRYYAAPAAHQGVIWVGGSGGAWDTPARGLYPHLAKELMEEGFSSLRVGFRVSTRLRECVYDVAAGLRYLADQGISVAALVGHSFGGAVVIRTAVGSAMVGTVIALAGQSSGAEEASQLGPRRSLLLVHGTGDEVVPSSCSESIFQLAREPKELVLFEGAGHALDEVAADVGDLISAWLKARI